MKNRKSKDVFGVKDMDAMLIMTSYVYLNLVIAPIIMGMIEQRFSVGGHIVV